MMNIREQIQTLRYWASADQDDGDLSSCDNEIADTMEKMLVVVEAAKKWKKELGPIDGTIGAWIELGKALTALDSDEKE